MAIEKIALGRKKEDNILCVAVALLLV